MKKIITTFLSTISAILLFVGGAAANEVQKEIGGWSEETGYYSELVSKDEISILSAPASHKGYVDYRTLSPTSWQKRAIGETYWNVSHYTKAWLQERNGTAIKGLVVVYGIGSSKAQSGWGIHYPHLAMQDPEVARTSYGRN